MQALVLADKYEVRSSMLTLFDGNKVVATFVSAGQGLAGTDWQVTAYNNGRNAVVSVQVGTELTAVFRGGRHRDRQRRLQRLLCRLHGGRRRDRDRPHRRHLPPVPRRPTA